MNKLFLSLKLGIIALFFLLLSSCSSNNEISTPEVEKFQYIPGDVSQIIINQPQKVSISNLGLEVNHNERAAQPLVMAFDGNMETKYHSPWVTDTPPTEFPIIITITLPSEYPSFDFLKYWPRQVGSNGRILAGHLSVSTKQSPSEFVNIKDFSYSADAAPKNMEIPAQYRGQIARLQLYISSGVADVVAIQEIEFFNYGAAFEIPDVFTDESCTQIKSGVTRKELEEITNSVFRNLALSLYDETYDMRRTGIYKSYPRPDVQAKINKSGTYSLLDNITGMYVKCGDDLMVFVGEHSHDLILRIMDHDLAGAEGFEGQNVVLTTGVNKIKAKYTGLAYLLFHNDSDESVKVNFASGEVNGYFDLDRDSQEDWQEMISQAKATRFDLRGKYSHLIFSTRELSQLTDDPVRLLQVYDSIVLLEDQFVGLYKYKKTHKSRMLFRCTPSATYMHATAYRTEYNPSTMAKLCDADRLRSSEIWGPAHEVGHIHQTRPGFNWKNQNNDPVLGEVSNNILSLHVQTTFGNPSKLEYDKKSYAPAYNSFMVKGIKHLEAVGVVDKKYFWEQLVHLWQLELYFNKAKGKKDFYKDLHEAIRLAPDPARNTEHYEFAYQVSKVSGFDMTEFFDRWGYDLSEDIKNRIVALGLPKLDQPIYYIRDSKVDCFKDNLSVIKGTATKSNSGELFSFSLSGWENVVAYEVYVDQQLKYISVEDQFSATLPQGEITIKAVGANGDPVTADL